MGLCYRTSLWLDRLWSEHLELSQPARDLVQAGIVKRGDAFAGFPADLHARLYLPSDPATIDPAPDWVTHLHELASKLGEWGRLKVMTSRNGFASGIATEVLLEQLLPHVADRPPERPSDRPGDPQSNRNPETQPGQGSRSAPPQEGPQDPVPPTPAQSSDSQLRASLRRAIRAARDAVQEAEAGLEGMNTPLGLSLPGSAVVPASGPANLKAVRNAHSRISSSNCLKRIAELAGRLERVAVAKARSKVKPGVGEVHGIGLGGLGGLPDRALTTRWRWVDEQPWDDVIETEPLEPAKT